MEIVTREGRAPFRIRRADINAWRTRQRDEKGMTLSVTWSRWMALYCVKVSERTENERKNALLLDLWRVNARRRVDRHPLQPCHLAPVQNKSHSPQDFDDASEVSAGRVLIDDRCGGVDVDSGRPIVVVGREKYGVPTHLQIPPTQTIDSV